MIKEPRNTRKSRLINDFVGAVTDLVSDGNNAPTKRQIVSAVVEASLGESASSSIRSILEDELANELERYWGEVCKAAAEAMGCLSYHYVNAHYYKSGRPVPRSKEEAQQYVVCFGNGRTGKAAGVRYPTAEDEPDVLLLVASEKDSETIRAAFETHERRLLARCMSPAVPANDVATLMANVPRLVKRDMDVPQLDAPEVA